MTIGIYKLVWKGFDKIYVGQSINIEVRYSSHKLAFKNKTKPPYLQKIFYKHGMPSLEIIEECSINELDEKEIYWIANTESVNWETGGKKYKIGLESPQCKYTKEQLLLVSNLLLDSTKKVSVIKEMTGVSKGTIEGILKRKRHSWIAEEDPKLWEQLGKVSRCSAAQVERFKTHCIIKDPQGSEHTVYNLSNFAKLYGLNKGHLCAMVRGEIKQHKGYVLVKNLKGGSDEYLYCI